MVGFTSRRWNKFVNSWCLIVCLSVCDGHCRAIFVSNLSLSPFQEGSMHSLSLFDSIFVFMISSDDLYRSVAVLQGCRMCKIVNVSADL